MSTEPRAVELPDLEVVRLLGEGKVAEVYLAREPKLHRLVAVKVLRPTLEETARLRFDREAQAVATLSHPGIVQLHRVGETTDGRPFLVIQYVKGRSLEERLAAEGPLAVPEARRILAEVADGLAAAHRQGIVHRDVKPANILIEDETGRVLLTDFGLAALLDSGSEAAPRITKTGQIVGDLGFMSPEQIRGEKVTGQADVYQLGLLAHHLLVNEGPFGSGPATRIVAAQLEQEPPDLTKLRPAVDPELAELVKRCLNKQANRRPTAADLGRRLREMGGSGTKLIDEEPMGFVKRRIPHFVIAAVVVGGTLLGAVSQLSQQGMFDWLPILDRVIYPLTLIFVVHGVTATAVISWFHGAHGKQRVEVGEIATLLALTASWIAWSVWTVWRLP
jgi:serine/threonine protein kinase